MLRDVERVHVVDPGDMLDADHPLVASPCAPARAGRRDRRSRRLRARRCAATRRRRHGLRSTLTPVPSRPISSTLPTMPTARITRSTVTSTALPSASICARHLIRAGFEALHRGAGVDLDPLLLEGLAGEGRDLFVLDRQHPVEHFDDRHLGAHVAVEAREFDADRARADDQQRFRDRRRDHRLLVGPHQLAVGFETRQRARPRPGREDDVLALRGRRPACRPSSTASLPLPASRPCAVEHVTLFLRIRYATPFDNCLATARERATTFLAS